MQSLDAFGDEASATFMCKVDKRTHHALTDRVQAEVTHQFDIKLEDVRAKIYDVGQARKPLSDVIDGEFSTNAS